jgi:hypothetical protein
MSSAKPFLLARTRGSSARAGRLASCAIRGVTVIGSALLCAACPPDVRVGIASGQRADALRFHIEDPDAKVAYTLTVTRMNGPIPEAVVWDIVSIGGTYLTEIDYGATPDSVRVDVAAEPLQPGGVYCAYAREWRKTCFLVAPDGTVFPYAGS